MPGRGAPVRGSCAVLRKLAFVQRLAAIKITGALSTTATDSLDLHSGLPPLPALANHALHRATLRLASLPAAHPLFKIVRKASKRRTKRHPSPLMNLFHAFQIDPDRVAKRYMVGGKETPLTLWHSVKVAESKDLAKEEDGEDRAEVRIYSDGSRGENAVGATAVLLRDGQNSR
jgi:hypothetical protein